MVPLEIFPDTMVTIAHFTPHAWGLDGFAELIRRGGTITSIATELAVLAGFAVALLALGAWRLRAKLTH
jgi:ABC-2 type transport system permease protein